MSVHELKSQPKPYQDVLDGMKRFEWRRNDRDFRKGDRLVLREWNQNTEAYTGRALEVRVVFIQPGGEFGIPSEFCILGIQFLRTLK